MTNVNMHRLLDQTFEDIGLLLGGLVATEAIPDLTITRLVEGLAGLRRASQRRAAQMARAPGHRKHPQEMPHPAIAKFLAEIRASSQASSTSKPDTKA